MDIGSEETWPSSALSNFAPHEFHIFGRRCASMEGLLQSLKTKDVILQRKISLLVGIEAKKAGRKLNKEWQATQTLWFEETPLPRHDVEYASVLYIAYNSLAMNNNFAIALVATNEEPLTHSVGVSDPNKTVLTENEFIAQLVRLRTKLIGTKEPPTHPLKLYVNGINWS